MLRPSPLVKLLQRGKKMNTPTEPPEEEQYDLRQQYMDKALDAIYKHSLDAPEDLRAAFNDLDIDFLHGVPVHLPKAAVDTILRLCEAAAPGWTIELPDLPYFQIRAFNEERGEWTSPIYDTKNLPANIHSVFGGKTSE